MANQNHPSQLAERGERSGCTQTRARSIATIAACGITSIACAQCVPGVPSDTDLFNYTRGTTITGSSGTWNGMSELPMFGVPGGPAGLGDLLFADSRPAGFVHWLEWQMPNPVRVSRFAFFGGEEGASVNFRRGFDRFSFFVWSGSSWTLLFEAYPQHPMPRLEGGTTYLESVTPVTATRFRIELVQRPLSFADQYPAGLYGPRVYELDAWDAAIAFLQQPEASTICLAGTARFTVTTTFAGATTYQWRKDGVPIDSSETGNPTAAMQTLELSAASISDVAMYDCIVTSPCGSITSNAAPLLLCPGDFNCDGGVDGADVGAFFSVWEAGESMADMNADGGVDGADVGAFFAHWESGC